MTNETINKQQILKEGKLYQTEDSDKNIYDHIFIYPPFRIYYRIDKSDLAPQDLSDKDHDGVPDYILHILEKFVVARLLLIHSFQLKDPLTNGFFAAKGAKFIDLKLKNIPVEHGLTSDRVFDEDLPILQNSEYSGKSLRIILHNKLYQHTATPIHELFHLFQYAYTHFNNMWYMEGLGRWSQSIIKESSGKTEPLPTTDSQLKALLKKWHDAEFFWNRLTDLCEPEKEFVIPQMLQGNEQIVNNKRSGSRFMSCFLQGCNDYTFKILQENNSRNISRDKNWNREEKRISQ